jgi:hypothetical protein
MKRVTETNFLSILILSLNIMKYNLDFCKQLALLRGGECVSKEYINTSQTLTWVCKIF